MQLACDTKFAIIDEAEEHLLTWKVVRGSNPAGLESLGGINEHRVRC